jgi:chemotaxis signal transduction protein
MTTALFIAPTQPVEPVAPQGIPALLGDGCIVVQIGATSYAVDLREVHEILRAPRVRVPDGADGEVLVVDARGRTVPVVDPRAAGRDDDGDVLLPVLRRQQGLVVDRVVAVLSADEIEVEQAEASPALPPTALAVLRVVATGQPVILIALPPATR